GPGLTVRRVGSLAAVSRALWGAGQLVPGPLSDRIGRKWLIAAGLGVQAAALALVALATTFTGWAVAAVLLGAGTAMVYPTLLAAISDIAHPAWRARSVGAYPPCRPRRPPPPPPPPPAVPRPSP